jgi:hypothetical protein
MSDPDIHAAGLPGDAVSAEDAALIAAVRAMLAKERTWFAMQTDSMFPYLRQGDETLLAAAGSPPERGAMVAFVRGGKVFVHRLLRIDADGRIVARGDSNWKPDGPMDARRFVGVVAAVRRRGRETPRIKDGLLRAWSSLRGGVRRLLHRLKKDRAS